MIASKTKMRISYLALLTVAVSVLAVITISGIGRIAGEDLIDDNRLAVYRSTLQSIFAHPLLGAGLGTFSDSFPALRSSDLWTWGVWDYAHSTVLEIAFEMGIPIATLVIVGALASVVVLARGALTAEAKDRRVLAAVTGISILGYLHSLIDFSLQIPGYTIIFGVLVGCGLARAANGRKTGVAVRGVTET